MLLGRRDTTRRHTPLHERHSDMARKSTIEFAEKTLSPALFSVYMQMTPKLSKTQLAAGELPPSPEEFAALQQGLAKAKAAKKAARKQAEECKAQTPAKPKARKAAKAPKAPKAPQSAEKRLKIFDALEVGFALTVRRKGEKALRVEVAKVNRKSIVCSDGVKLHLKGGDVSASLDGKAVALTGLRYKAPKGGAEEPAAVASEASEPVKPKARKAAAPQVRKPAKAKAKASSKSPTKKEAAKLAEAARKTVCEGVQFNVLDMEPMMKRVEQAIMDGHDPLETMGFYCMMYRKN